LFLAHANAGLRRPCGRFDPLTEARRRSGPPLFLIAVRVGSPVPNNELQMGVFNVRGVLSRVCRVLDAPGHFEPRRISMCENECSIAAKYQEKMCGSECGRAKFGVMDQVFGMMVLSRLINSR
jgi:hypothetical protein